MTPAQIDRAMTRRRIARMVPGFIFVLILGWSCAAVVVVARVEANGRNGLPVPSPVPGAAPLAATHPGLAMLVWCLEFVISGYGIWALVNYFADRFRFYLRRARRDSAVRW